MSFIDWMKENVGEDYFLDIASNGADAGYPGLTWTADMVKVYDEYEEEIYEALMEDVEALGFESPEDMIRGFNRKDMLSDPHNRKALLVWYMAERIASNSEFVIEDDFS